MGNFDYISFIDNLSEQVVKCNEWITTARRILCYNDFWFSPKKSAKAYYYLKLSEEWQKADENERNRLFDLLPDEENHPQHWNVETPQEEKVNDVSFFVSELIEEAEEIKKEFQAIETIFLGYGIAKKENYNFIIFNKCFENLKYVITELQAFTPTIENLTLSLNPPHDLDIEDYNQEEEKEEVKPEIKPQESEAQETIKANHKFNRETIGLLIQYLQREGIISEKSKTEAAKKLAPLCGYSDQQLRKTMSLNAQTATQKDKETLAKLLREILSELE